MEKVKFWNLNGLAWSSVEEVKEEWVGTLLQNGVAGGLDFNRFLKTPLDYLEELYAQNTDSVKIWEKDVLTALHYKLFEHKISESDGVYNKIPSLNDPEVLQLSNGQVVSFRCMIQNNVESDFWPNQLMVKDPSTGVLQRKPTLLRDLFKDIEPVPDDVELVEKEIFIAITPPGESAWVSGVDITNGLAGQCKRIKLSDNEEGIISLPNYKALVPVLFQNHDETKPMGCHLKILHDDNAEKVKPNDIVEVTGLIYFNESSEEEEARNMELSPAGLHKLPILHVFSCIKLSEGMPQLPLFERKFFPLMNTADLHLSECANLLRELLSLGLGGDRYAAVYLMTALVSRVLQKETSAHGPIGKFALNISGFPEKSDLVNEIQYVLKAIVPRTLKLEVSTEFMNKCRLTPTLSSSTAETNLLEPNLLQIASGTQVILDETKLEEGLMIENGIKNVEVLRELIIEQHVKYNYTYQLPLIPTRVPVISLSSSPSILPTDTRIQLKVDAKLTIEERRKRIEQILSEHGEQLRAYLGIARSVCLLPFQLFEEETLQDEFEKFFRTRNQPGFVKKMTPTEFSGFITSCRLWCLLHGQYSITREGFKFWKEIELIRDSRFAPA